MRCPHAFANLCLLLAIGIGACSDDDNPVDPNEPFPLDTPVPAVLGFNFDEWAADFSSPPNSGEANTCRPAVVPVIAWWDSVLTDHGVRMSRFLLSETLNESPTYLGEETWRWAASGFLEGDEWNAVLDGAVSEGDWSVWSLRVNGTPNTYEDFVLLEGSTHHQQSALSGEWSGFIPGRDTPAWAAEFVWQDEEWWWVSLAPQDQSRPPEGLEYRVVADTVMIGDSRNRIRWLPSTGEGSWSFDYSDSVCCWGNRPAYDDLPCPSSR